MNEWMNESINIYYIISHISKIQNAARRMIPVHVGTLRSACGTTQAIDCTHETFQIWFATYSQRDLKVNPQSKHKQHFFCSHYLISTRDYWREWKKRFAIMALPLLSSTSISKRPTSDTLRLRNWALLRFGSNKKKWFEVADPTKATTVNLIEMNRMASLHHFRKQGRESHNLEFASGSFNSIHRKHSPLLIESMKFFRSLLVATLLCATLVGADTSSSTSENGSKNTESMVFEDSSSLEEEVSSQLFDTNEPVFNVKLLRHKWGLRMLNTYWRAHRCRDSLCRDVAAKSHRVIIKRGERSRRGRDSGLIVVEGWLWSLSCVFGCT